MDFRLPICRALTQDILLAGGARSIVILNSTIAAIFLIALGNIWIMPVFIFFHILIVLGSKHDSKFFDCFKAYLKYKKFYHS